MRKILFITSFIVLNSCTNENATSVSNSDSLIVNATDSVLAESKDLDDQNEKPLDVQVKESYASLKENKPVQDHYLTFHNLSLQVGGTDYEKRVEKTKDSLNSKQIIQKRKETVAERKEYAKNFQNNLWDVGLNINVSTSGKLNEKITLKYIRFNDVYFRKFETEGYFQKLHNEGFKEIILTDGYDYTKRLVYDN